MEDYKKRLSIILAETGSLFFDKDLILKDGRPTPYFVNFGMFRTGRLSIELGSLFAEMIVANSLCGNHDIILGPSYKGSAIALATSISLYKDHGLDLFFEYDRKEEKLHGEGSKSGSILVNRTLYDGCRVFIVDDVATSMGTKYELLDRLFSVAQNRNISINITGVGIAINREQTTAIYDESGRVIEGKKGENAIGNFITRTKIPVYFVAGIREVVEYLFQEEIPVMINGDFAPIDDGTKLIFDEYLHIYGIE